MLDKINLRILSILQSDARTSYAEIARKLGMAPSAIMERIRKLETAGVIEGYTARINPRALDLGLTAFIFVRTDDQWDTAPTSELLAAIPEVLEVHHVAGEDCFLVKVRARDTDTLGALLREQFGACANVRTTRTTIVLQTVKETGTLPIHVGEESIERE